MTDGLAPGALRAEGPKGRRAEEPKSRRAEKPISRSLRTSDACLLLRRLTERAAQRLEQHIGA